MRRLSKLLVGLALVAGASLVGGGQTHAASTFCVNNDGSGGCMTSLQSAVDAAVAGDTVTISGTLVGTSVTITKPLTLTGSGPGAEISAGGQPFGIKVDGTSNVTISNLQVSNADAPGIWVTSSSNVTITGNTLTYNDLALTPAGTCAPAPPTDQDDCGGTIFLDNVTNSTISNNVIEHNADGLTLTDETGPSSGNTITGNTVMFNAPECGIVLASHSGTAPNGVFNNVVSDNNSSNNGASGVGIFSPFPGTAAYNNTVTGNVFENNGHGGVTLHTHAPGTNDNNNVITNNTFSNDNTAGDDSAGDYVTTAIILAAAVNPIMGTTIEGNTINNETIGLFLGNAVNSTISGNTNNATTPELDVSASQLPSQTSPGTGVPVGTVSAAAYAWNTSSGLSTGFAVTDTTASNARIVVMFGTSCSGLTGTATQDMGAGTTSHWLLVTHDEYSNVGTGLVPGTTYYYAVETVGAGTVTVDNNGGKCYSVAIPTTPTVSGPPSAPSAGA